MTNPDSNEKPVILVALGGNALIRKGERGTARQQLANLVLPIKQIARLAADYRIIITHGNGPQVGNLLLQQERTRETPEMPLEILVAQTQGQIGYMIESTLDQELMKLGVNTKPLVSLISYVVVDKDDPAFDLPSKPVGPVYSQSEAEKKPYPTIKTAKGYRRVVVSPRPVTIVEKREIKRLIGMDFIVICCGGGGIPVTRKGRAFQGVDAVIDKDLASVRLAEEVGVDIFIIATDVEGAMLDFGGARQRLLRRMTLDEGARHLVEETFPAGSMAPKIEACMQFISSGGQRAIITSIGTIEAAVRGKAGTEFFTG